MKRFSSYLGFLLLGLSPLLSAGDLKFESKVIEVTADPDQDLVTADFVFTAAGKGSAVIEKHEAACSCLEAQISNNGKMVWEPGETGTVRGLFKVGNFRGTVDKEISLLMKDGKRHNLIVRMTMPELMLIEPKTLKWEQGEASVAKSFDIQLVGDEPIEITGLTGTNQEKFPYEMSTVEEGKRYRLTVTPSDTDERGFGLIRITTNSKHKKHKSYQAFAVVSKPVVSTTAVIR